MTTENVFDWIKSLTTKADNYYCGILNSKKDKSFGIYPLKSSREREVVIGGANGAKAKGISILIHWNTSTRETETIALNLYADLAAIDRPMIGDKQTNYIKLLHDEPIYVGTDDNGVCEYVIELVIYYERS